MAGPRPTKPDPKADELTAAEAAWLSHLSVSTVYARIRNGQLDAVWTGGTVRVPRQAALALTRKRAAPAKKSPGGGENAAAKTAA